MKSLKWTQLKRKSFWEYKDWKKAWEEEKIVLTIKKGACMIVIQMMAKTEYMEIWILHLSASYQKKLQIDKSLSLNNIANSYVAKDGKLQKNKVKAQNVP